MKSYPQMKKSGIPWLGKVPDGWKIYTLRQIFRAYSEKNCPNLPLLSVVRDKGVILRNINSKEENHNYIPDDLNNYKRVKIGQFVINKMKSWQGSYGISIHEGIVSPAYYIFDIRTQLNTSFLNIAIRSKSYISFFGQASDGIRVDQWDLALDKMKNIPFLLPPRPEQDQIVQFLDWKVSQINRLVNIKKHTIERLEELKKAVITRAVTRGLDSNVKLKDSGISWLGCIPMNWEILPIKHVCKVNASISHITKNYNDDRLITFLPMEKVSVDGQIDCTQKEYYKNVKTGYSSFAKNDVVIAKITPCFENGKGACLDKLDTEVGFGTTEFINMRAYSCILAKYLYYITKNRVFRMMGADNMTGSAGQKRVPVEFIKNYPIAKPPLHEQEQIILYLDQKTTEIDASIANARAQIERYQEFKQRLIADVVTGKIDVRDIEVPEYEYEEEIAGDSEDEDIEEYEEFNEEEQ